MQNILTVIKNNPKKSTVTYAIWEFDPTSREAHIESYVNQHTTKERAEEYYGRSWPKFTASGKTWSSIGQLKNHLRLFDPHSYPRPDHYTIPKEYNNCEIVVVELVVTEKYTMNLEVVNDA